MKRLPSVLRLFQRSLWKADLRSPAWTPDPSQISHPACLCTGKTAWEYRGFRAAEASQLSSAGCESAAAPLPTSINACQGIVQRCDGALGSRSGFGDRQKPFWHLASPDVLMALPVWHSGKVFQQQMSQSDRFFSPC